ncbi:MAG: FtsX-like permease family protein [Bacteroides sp.]|nr:FtsX-like permease family protein [Bacteroides sp.]
MRKFIARFRQAPMFSTVYILGAALSVASVMLVAIFLHVKTSNIYPEYSRDRLLYLSKSYFSISKDQGNNRSFTMEQTSSFSPRYARIFADSLNNIATVAIIKNPPQASEINFRGNRLTNLLLQNVYVGDERFENVSTLTATPEIFSVYDYEFIDGAPFKDASGPNVAISDRLARRIFGTDKGVTGRTFNLSVIQYLISGNFTDEQKEFTVCGVFKEGSRLLPSSFTEIIVPLDINKEIEVTKIELSQPVNPMDGQGEFNLVILPHEGVSPASIKEAILTQINRLKSQPFNCIITYAYMNGQTYRNINTMDEILPEEYEFTIGSYPRSALQMQLGNPENIYEKFNFVGLTKLYGLLILILLLVPALNLSSLISGNMDSKMSEMGIRKAFGARNSTLLRQVVNENLWLTGCGAILGIILAWVGVLLWKDWLFAGIGSEGGSLSASDVMLDPAMLFAPKVFIAAVIICMVLNLFSSLIPAWWALRRPAIDAIKAKS